MVPITDNWYYIPGYTGYQINRKTGLVRSFKNFKADPYHIMKVDKHGYVTVSNDIKGSVKITPQKLYDLTFNSGVEPELARGGVYMGGRSSMSKDQSKPIGMDFSQFIK